MARSRGLAEIAMSVPPGTLTDDFCNDVIAFYGDLLEWSEIAALRAPDQLTLHVGRRSFVNLRERTDSMTYHGYEHVGVLVESAEIAEALYEQVAGDSRDLGLEAMERTAGGARTFRFRYRLPMAIEVQFIP
jgi:hypothetical protein